MRGLLVVIMVAGVAAVGGWLFMQNYAVTSTEHGWTIQQRTPTTRASMPFSRPAARPGGSIRIASFNIQVFGNSKLSKTHVMDALAEIVRQFDVVAIQEIRSANQDVIPRFVDMINASGRHYDYVIGPRLGRTSSKEQYAFVFDQQTLEVDRNQLYSIEDPEDLLHRPPLVGWFRTRGAKPEEAFTFTLVNLHTDPDEVEKELRVIDGVYAAVRNDGRQEDDVIILGDFNAPPEKLMQMMRTENIRCAISGVPTNVARTKQYDNLVFDEEATDEFTGRFGVLDFLRKYNLTIEAAQEISDHFPVWAEFSSHEGGQPGRVATASGPKRG